MGREKCSIYQRRKGSPRVFRGLLLLLLIICTDWDHRLWLLLRHAFDRMTTGCRRGSRLSPQHLRSHAMNVLGLRGR